MDKYSAYGIPFGLPGGDTNSDGDDDSADATQIQTWIDTSTYDVRGDVDLDGDVDSTDKTLAQGAPITGNTLAWSVLDDDAFRNRRGIAGYEHALCTSLLIVRTRVLNASLGRWARRDPLGYVDGPSLYEYVRSAPLKRVDPLGHFRL
jgi:RHS repeat-associated protein